MKRLLCNGTAMLLALSFPIVTSAQTFFFEDFEDANLTSRGWYDTSGITLSSTEHIPGSSKSFECTYNKGATSCAGGSPGRHLFPASQSVYLSYWVKYSANWEGSNTTFHPHEFLFLTDANTMYAGPAWTHLTLYVEQNEGVPLLALQDGANVDLGCILLNNGSSVGCNGDFATYSFTENRSVAACNGVDGYFEYRDCFPWSGGTYYSSRTWKANGVYFSDAPGSNYKSDWHHIEAYFELNTLSDGIGVADGVIRYWFDGQLLIASNQILFRTAQHATMGVNQFLLLPYIGSGSPVTQTMWVDDLLVAARRPAALGSPPGAPTNLRIQ